MQVLSCFQEYLDSVYSAPIYCSDLFKKLFFCLLGPFLFSSVLRSLPIQKSFAVWRLKFVAKIRCGLEFYLARMQGSRFFYIYSQNSSMSFLVINDFSSLILYFCSSTVVAEQKFFSLVNNSCGCQIFGSSSRRRIY